MANISEQMEQVLTTYRVGVEEKIRVATEAKMKELVKKTKATAPKGKREGEYKRHITADYSRLRKPSARGLQGNNISATWYVRAPEYRLTHLLVNGHATRDGGRTQANPFLQNAVDQVIPEYEREIEEILQDGN